MVSRLTAKDECIQLYFFRLTRLDRLIHEPSRLGVLCVLSAQKESSVSYLELFEVTGLSRGNLSNHLAKLEGAGIVEIQKRFVGKKPETLVSLTRFGAEKLTSHLEQMCQIREGLEATEVEED